MSDNSPSNMSNHLFNAHKEEAAKVKEMFIAENGGPVVVNGGGKRKKNSEEPSFDASTGTFKDERKRAKRAQTDESVTGLIAEARQRLHYEVRRTSVKEIIIHISNL
jgi:hypothetical protein